MIHFDNLFEISKKKLSYSEILPMNCRKRPLFTVNYPDPDHYNNRDVSLDREPRFARIKIRTVLPPVVNAPTYKAKWLPSEIGLLHSRESAVFIYRAVIGNVMGRIPGVSRMRINSFAWAFNAGIVLPFFHSKIKVPITIADCRVSRVISRNGTRDTNSLVGLDEWNGQERKVVCREEEQVQKEKEIEEDEA